MLLTFRSPEDLSGAALESPVTLEYAHHTTLSLRCEDAFGNPLDLASYGVRQWRARISATPGCCERLAEWVMPAPEGNVLKLELGMYDKDLFCFLAGRPETPATLEIRGYAVEDTEGSLAYSIPLPVVVACSSDIRTPIDVHAALLEELAWAVTECRRAQSSLDGATDAARHWAEVAGQASRAAGTWAEEARAFADSARESADRAESAFQDMGVQVESAARSARDAAASASEAVTSAAEARDSAAAALTSSETAGQSARGAVESERQAGISAGLAAGSASAAEESAVRAENAFQDMSSQVDAAAESARQSAESARASQASAGLATGSASAAEQSAVRAENAFQDMSSQVDAANAAANRAAAEATAAGDYADRAGQNAQAAQASADLAAGSAAAAAGSLQAVQASADAAAGAAATAAESAARSETQAQASAGSAAAAETSRAESERQAGLAASAASSASGSAAAAGLSQQDAASASGQAARDAESAGTFSVKSGEMAGQAEDQRHACAVWNQGTDEEVAALGGVHSCLTLFNMTHADRLAHERYSAWCLDVPPAPLTDEWLGRTMLLIGPSAGDLKRGHIYVCRQVDGVPAWVDVNTGTFPVGPCKDVRCITQGDRVLLRWRDPQDAMIGDAMVARWKRTVVMRKQGAFPTGLDDGTQVAVSDVRNQYLSAALTDVPGDTSLTWYYQLFALTDDGMVTTDEGARAVTGKLTWADINMIVRSGQARDFFSIGDTLQEKLLSQDLQKEADWEWEVADFDPGRLQPETLARAPEDDLSGSFAWRGRCASVYTEAELPAPAAPVFADADRTQRCGSCGSVSPAGLSVTFEHGMLLLPKWLMDNTQFDAPEDAYGLTWDKVFDSSRELSVKLGTASSRTRFILDDPEATGKDRRWISVSGTRLVMYSRAASRWEIWNASSSTREPTGASAAYTQNETGLESPAAGTWTGSTEVAPGKVYYTRLDGVYSPAVSGEGFQEGTPIPADTWYEANPNYGQRQYGFNHSGQSGARQYLNSRGKGWWKPQNPWDKAPSSASLTGFLDRIPPEMLEALGWPVSVTARNTTDAGGGSYETADRFFLLSWTQVGKGALNGVEEGHVLELYQGTGDAGRIKTTPEGGAVYWWLRSPNTGNSINVYYVYPSGAVNHYLASDSYRLAPACCIV